jgi:hypothetical protein
MNKENKNIVSPSKMLRKRDFLNSGLDNTYEISSASYSGKDIHRVELDILKAILIWLSIKKCAKIKLESKPFKKLLS